MASSVLRFNQAAPGLEREDVAARYRATVEMAAFADEAGLDMVTLEEHHGADNGWSPAPLATAGAVLGASRRIAVMVSALITPLYDPLRLAEETAVLDHIGRGRLSLVAGIGYRPEEYEMFDREWKRRGRLQDEVLETLLAAWTGEPFTYRGRTVRVTPPPYTRPHPPLLVGGTSMAAVRRAVRLRLPFFSADHLPELADSYNALAAEEGFEGGFALLPPSSSQFVFCTEDPDRAWAEHGEHFLHEARTYSGWQRPEISSAAASHANETVDQLRAEGVYRCLTPEECVAEAREQGPLGALILHPLCGGLPIEAGWSSLQLYADRVLPRLKETAAA
ncbi:LLM class flavin-dependent oxidoreductase [Streptomyces sp. ODS28]|uniref:LLM class flavin-dependent oxidoreductase n=1 Tax=Streptomyces sp. ODS28 TaxID=3136688 RepID=UPI0031E602AD